MADAFSGLSFALSQPTGIVMMVEGSALRRSCTSASISGSSLAGKSSQSRSKPSKP